MRTIACALAAVSLPIVALAQTVLGPSPVAPAIPSGWQAKDVKPVAYLNLKAQRGFKLTMKKTDSNRWYLFAGTTNPGGFHVIDVTDPAKPTIAKVIESERGSAQITSAGDLLLLGAQLPFTDRGTPRPFRQPAQDLELVTLWDIKDPLNPQRLAGSSARTPCNSACARLCCTPTGRMPSCIPRLRAWSRSSWKTCSRAWTPRISATTSAIRYPLERIFIRRHNGHAVPGSISR